MELGHEPLELSEQLLPQVRIVHRVHHLAHPHHPPFSVSSHHHLSRASVALPHASAPCSAAAKPNPLHVRKARTQKEKEEREKTV
eukprot:260848-Rhodomonas_salina.1